MKSTLVFAATALVIGLELLAISTNATRAEVDHVTAVALPAFAAADDKEYNSCVEKVGSEWGTKIGKCAEYEGYKAVYDDTYRVDFKNNCSEKLDVMVAVQEEDKTWNCKVLTGIGANAEFSHYACKGAGKCLWWARAAGDETTTFLSPEEVNEMYPD